VRRLAGLGAAVVALALAGSAGEVRAQDTIPPAPPVGELRPVDVTERTAREQPPLPATPPRRIDEYRLGPVLSGLAWEEDAAMADGALAGFAVERDVASFLALRAGLGYGTTELAPPDVVDAGAVDTRLYLPEVSLVLQPVWGEAGAWPVRPYGLVSFASLISDPDREGVSTRSQNAFGYGAGARLRVGRRLGILGEIERYLVKLEDPFDATRESRSVHNTRFGGSVTYAF
jgi:hypothetical protein